MESLRSLQYSSRRFRYIFLTDSESMKEKRLKFESFSYNLQWKLCRLNSWTESSSNIKKFIRNSRFSQYRSSIRRKYDTEHVRGNNNITLVYIFYNIGKNLNWKEDW